MSNGITDAGRRDAVVVNRSVLGPLSRTLELIGQGDLIEAGRRIEASHPIPPMGKEMIVAALRTLRLSRGGEWGDQSDAAAEIRRELTRRPTIHIDIGGGNALLIETGREGAA